MDGEQLLKYQGDLERILCVCVRLRCKRVYTLACSLLEHTLRSMSLIYPTEHRSTPGGFAAGLPIRVNTRLMAFCCNVLASCSFSLVEADGRPP